MASNGYVLVRVAKDHHLADVRGYAYEHRVVAEQSLGRRLRKGEQVHHRDGNKQNNAPENLDVMESAGHHHLEHRGDNAKAQARRRPGDDNPRVACECGCGAEFDRFDALGRPRRFMSGHNQRQEPR